MVYRMYRIQKERRKMTDFAECSMAMQYGNAGFFDDPS